MDSRKAKSVSRGRAFNRLMRSLVLISILFGSIQNLTKGFAGVKQHNFSYSSTTPTLKIVYGDDVDVNDAANEPSSIWSTVHIETPWLAKNDPEQQQIAGREVHMTNVMWAGEYFILNEQQNISNPNDGELVELTKKLHTSWYYASLSRSGTLIMGMSSNMSFDGQRCDRIVEEPTFVVEPKWCGNEWHCIHDSIMPLIAAIGNRNNHDLGVASAADAEDDSPPLQSWNISQIRVATPNHKNADTTYRNAHLFMKPFVRVISSHPLEQFPPPQNTCYRKLILSGSQRLNLYKTHTKRLCEDIQWWQKRYLTGLELSLPSKKEKEEGMLGRTVKIRWIARTGSREVMNRNQVIQALHNAFNITIDVVKLEGLPHTEQIKIFIESDIIIGPHGAGLAKLLFMRKGSGILQLVPFGMENLPYWQYPDGQVWNKGDNFICGAKCVGAHYRQYNATWEESGWSKVPIQRRPRSIEDPASLVYNQPHTFADYTAGRSKRVDDANAWYVSDKNTYFTAKPDVVVRLVGELLEVIGSGTIS